MSLPKPDADGIAHSQRVRDFIKKHLQKSGGFISFAEYMQMALYAPGLGYYSAGKHKFGPGGDYITAPEISPILAQALSCQCQEIFKDLPRATILELGAGSGVLAKDLILDLERAGCLPEAYYILELSADLRARQKKLLAEHCAQFYSSIHWLDSLENVSLNGVILANEVLDALPVQCFQISQRQVKERVVVWQNDHFTWETRPPVTPGLLDAVLPLFQAYAWGEGYRSEVCLMLSPFIRTLSNILQRGVMLFLDYGYGQREYYHPDRVHGTLMSFYAHHSMEDPFLWPGLQDITAHVDFTSVAMATELSLSGFTTQAGFLLATGVLNERKFSLQEQNKIKKLIFPSQMGELIKVIGLQKDFNQPLKGFSFIDRRASL